MQLRSQQFVKYAVNTIVVRMLVFAFAIASTIITARVLGPSGKGLYSVLTLTAAIALMIGELGFGHAVVYYIGNKKLSLKECVSSSLFTQVLISIVITGLLVLAIKHYKETIYANLPYSYVWMVVGLFPFILFSASLRSAIQGLYKIPLLNLLHILQSAGFLLLLYFLLVVFDWSLKGAIIAWGTSSLIGFFILFLAVIRENGLGFSGVNSKAIKKLFSFGIRTYGGNFLKFIQYRFDIIIVAYFLPPTAVGYYAVATTVAEVVWQFPNAVQTVLFPRIASLSKSDAKDFTPTICRQVVLITGIACCLLLVIANVLIPFAFGQEYSPSIRPLAILLPGVFTLAIWKILHADLVAQGFPIIYSFTALLSTLTMVLLDFFFIPAWGINGAAFACSVSYVVSTIPVIYFYKRISKNNLGSFLLPRVSDFAFYKLLLKKLIVKQPASSLRA